MTDNRCNMCNQDERRPLEVHSHCRIRHFLLIGSVQMAEGKLTYQHTHSEHSSEPARKRRREALRVEHVTSVAEHFKPADLSSVKQVRKSQIKLLV